jgi:hypothetical protein
MKPRVTPAPEPDVYVPFTATMPKRLIAAIDERAVSLGLSRAAYHYCGELAAGCARAGDFRGSSRPGLARWQQGQRGSQLARARAMASRAVMNESAKCRSGRELERIG